MAESWEEDLCYCYNCGAPATSRNIGGDGGPCEKPPKHVTQIHYISFVAGRCKLFVCVPLCEKKDCLSGSKERLIRMFEGIYQREKAEMMKKHKQGEKKQ